MLNLYRIDKEGQKVSTDVKKKVVDLALLAKVQVAAAVADAASNVSVLAATALTAEVQTITANITDPNTPRSIIIKGNQAGVAGNVVINGKDYDGATISETIALNGDTAVEGVKAFKEVDSIELPVEVNVGTDTVSIGTGEKLGIPYRLPHNTVLATYLDNVLEGTAPTITTSATALESNTIKLNSTLNDTVVDYYLMV